MLRALGSVVKTGFKTGTGTARAAGAAAPTVVKGAAQLTDDVARLAIGTTKVGYRAAMFSPFTASRRVPIFAPELMGTKRSAPFQFSAALQNRLVAGSIGVGVLGGAYSTTRGEYKNFSAEMSPSGRLEITRPDMLGATGDIPLALHNNRR